MLKRIFLPAVLIGAALCSTALAQNLFVSSGDNVSAVVNVFREDPFTGPTSFFGAANTFLALPAGQRYYVVSKNALSTVMIVDANMIVQRRIDLGAPASTGAVSPDGRRILILASALKIYDTATDQEVQGISGDAGVNPNDVAFSFDSRRAYVLSSTSQRLTTIDLVTNTIIGTSISIPGTSTAVTTGPNGLVYVSAQQSVYEYQYDANRQDLLLRGQYSLNGLPGKLSFTPDATKAVAVNQGISGSSTGSIYVLDLVNRNLFGAVPVVNLSFTKALVADNNRFFAIASQNQKLYQLNFSNLGNIQEATFSGIGSYATVRDIAMSYEAPQPRFMFVSSSSTVSRIELSSTQVSGTIGIAGNTAGDLSFAAPGNPGAASALLQYNNSQIVAAGGLSLPLMVRVTDYVGRPIYNTRVNFSTATSGVSIQTSSSLTGIDGVTGTSVVVPVTAGQFTVVASVENSVLSAAFQITVGGSGGVNPTSGLQIYAGNGQVLTEFSSTASQESMKVRIVDASGNPVVGVGVSWAVNDQLATSGYLDRSSSTTDTNGIAEANFISSSVAGGGFLQPYGRSTIVASTGAQSVNFTVLTLASQPGGTQGFIGVNLIKPGDQRIVGKVGVTIPGAIQLQISANGTSPLPGVGIRVFDASVTSTTAPASLCTTGTVLTDSNGMASCDLAVTGVVGTRSITIRTGSVIDTPVTLVVTAGDPGGFKNVQGNNQEGVAGARLPIALAAEVTDSFGNTITGGNVTWEVPVAGSVTLSNVVSTSDNLGRVSALATLGTTPGTAQVILRAGSASVTFNLTVKVTISGMAYVSGDGQLAEINKAFAQPLVVKVTDPQGKGLANIDVRFDVLGGTAVLGGPTARTDANGLASMFVTAGSSAGAIAIQASLSGLSPVRFNLNSRLPGPVLDQAQILNAASFQRGIAPGTLMTIYGAGIASSLKGAIVANSIGIGPLPTKLNDVEVLFGSTAAPILSVANINGQESVSIQVPWELPASSLTSITVRVSGGSSTINNVAVQALSPGLFETTDAAGRRYAIVLKADGSFATPENPARRGEKLKMYATGLGQTTPNTGTNRVGVPNQNLIASVTVGVNSEGIDALPTTTLSDTMVGIYEISFELNSNTAQGLNVPLVIGVDGPDGRRVYSNDTKIAAIQ